MYWNIKKFTQHNNIISMLHRYGKDTTFRSIWYRFYIENSIIQYNTTSIWSIRVALFIPEGLRLYCAIVVHDRVDALFLILPKMINIETFDPERLNKLKEQYR